MLPQMPVSLGPPWNTSSQVTPLRKAWLACYTLLACRSRLLSLAPPRGPFAHPEQGKGILRTHMTLSYCTPLHNYHRTRACSSTRGPQTSSKGITRGLVRTAESWPCPGLLSQNSAKHHPRQPLQSSELDGPYPPGAALLSLLHPFPHSCVELDHAHCLPTHRMGRSSRAGTGPPRSLYQPRRPAPRSTRRQHSPDA